MATDEEKRQLILDLLDRASEVDTKDPVKSHKQQVSELIYSKMCDLYKAVEDFYGPENTDFNYHGQDKDMSAEANEIYFSSIPDHCFNSAKIKKSGNEVLLEFDRVDANYTSSFANSFFSITIRIPEINVLSENGKTHKMVECYVRFMFSRDLRINNVRFFRGKRSVKEADSDYLFSHCERTGHQGNSGRNFCFGTNTSISRLYAVVSNSSYNEDDVIMFIYGMKDYLSYESISGTPYIRIEEIKIRNGRADRRGLRISTQELDNIYKGFIKEGEKFLFSFQPNGSINIKSTPELWRKISKLVNESYLFEYDEARNICIYSEGDTEDELNLCRSYNSAWGSTILTFKGSPVKEQIYAETKEEEKKEKVCREDIRDYVINRLKISLNEYTEQRFQSYSI